MYLDVLNVDEMFKTADTVLLGKKREKKGKVILHDSEDIVYCIIFIEVSAVLERRKVYHSFF